ncbi:MAG: hypothetical protein LBV33_01575 [Lachnospiraceae bacterium]|jgi:hypothetical protein|nr:hypothetical protein [Lachnospiraceae bacterium]
MKKYLETGMMIVAICGFFGFVYPELCLIDDTYRVAEEQVSLEYEEQSNGANVLSDGSWSGEGKSDGSVDDAHGDSLRIISDMPRGTIRFKSRLLEFLFAE